MCSNIQTVPQERADPREGAGLQERVGRDSESGISSGIGLSACRQLSSPVGSLHERYDTTRSVTQQLCHHLSPEDCLVQSMVDASPTKWHLAHSTWFFETLVLPKVDPHYRSYNEAFGFLFNSYYNALGARIDRPDRGLLSRPTLDEVRDYRRHVDDHMRDCFQEIEADPELVRLVETGINHEQQHQELILTDIKHVFASNPLLPAYTLRSDTLRSDGQHPISATSLSWRSYGGGLYETGHDRAASAYGHDRVAFAYDNESPRHKVYLNAFSVASRLITCEEYLEFMDDGGYERSELWLADGWDAVRQHGWSCPLYWRMCSGAWCVFGLCGDRPITPEEPVCHVSYYEADAFARWFSIRYPGARLLTESEWEIAACDHGICGNLLETGRFHPQPATFSADSAGFSEEFSGPAQLFGDCWEWTQSAYMPYPGFSSPPGALGEYNGKFMCNQMVLRGGSCVTPGSHIRQTYRNFFYPHVRWQFSGIRIGRQA